VAVACFKRLAFWRLFVAFSVWRMFVALVALIWLLECWGRIPSSSVSVWYMRSHPTYVRLLFVFRSAWRCLVWSSFLSVCFFDSLAITVAVSDTRSVLRLLAGIFSFFRASILLWPPLSASCCSLLVALRVSQLGVPLPRRCCLFSSIICCHRRCLRLLWQFGDLRPWFSLSLLLAVVVIGFVLSSFIVVHVVAVCRLQHGLLTTVCPRD